MTILLNLHLSFKFKKPFIHLSVRNNKLQGAKKPLCVGSARFGLWHCYEEVHSSQEPCAQAQQPVAPPQELRAWAASQDIPENQNCFTEAGVEGRETVDQKSVFVYKPFLCGVLDSSLRWVLVQSL